LHLSVRQASNKKEIIRLLVAAGADLGSADNAGRTPLSEAIHMGFDIRLFSPDADVTGQSPPPPPSSPDR
jgi:ankyrin repeat protein